jgi:sugar phosphate permease
MTIKNIYYGWWIVFVCMTIGFCVAGTIFYGFTAFFDPLVAEFGWSYTQISLAASLRGLEMGLFAPVVGWLVDRYGPRRLMLSGVAVTGAGFFLMASTRNLPMFYGAMILLSFGAGGCTSVVSMTAIANWFDHKIGRAIGIMASGFGLSGLIVPLLVWLISIYGWRGALFVIGFGMLGIGIPLSLVIRDRPEDYGWHPDGINPEKAPWPKKLESDNGSETLFQSAVRDRAFILLCVVEVFRLGVTTSVITHIMPYLATMGFDRATAGMITATIPLISVMGRFAVGWLSDSVPKHRLLAATCCLICLGLLALGFVKTIGMLFTFLLLFPVGFGGGMVLRGAIVRDYFGRSSFGKIIGMVMGISAVGSVVGPTMTGWIFDLTGSYFSVWMALAMPVGLSMLLALNVRKSPVSK